MKILVTGTAGFIGYHTTVKLLNQGNTVIGLDVINDYYDINLKYTRLANLGFGKDKAVSRIWIDPFCPHLYLLLTFLPGNVKNPIFQAQGNLE